MSDLEFVPARIVLENGLVLEGKSFGSPIDSFGEIVFNTSMTGYQEIITDPSYAGQTIVFTYPLIGNYGVNEDDIENLTPKITGIVVRQISRIVSNWKATDSLPNFLKKHNIPAIEAVDTRFLTLNIRDEGAMRCLITHDLTTSVDDLVEKIKLSPDMNGADLAKVVTTKSTYTYQPDHQETGFAYSGKPLNYKIVAVDYGIKQNMLRILHQAGCEVTVVPCTTTFEEIVLHNPDGIFLSNGPGDPAAVTYAIDVVRQIIESGIPTFGICLGHQISALALGGKTYKMKFGHRGANHPVKDLTTNKIEITSQNHGFAVDAKSLPDPVEITHINLNDQTNEGMKHKAYPFFSVQYHPESSPGPHDSHYLFDRFFDLIKSSKKVSV